MYKLSKSSIELIKECPHSEYEKWKKWYLDKNPKAIDNATKKINDMVSELKEAIKKIDESMVKEWVEDLVLDKTFIGLKFQEIILKNNVHRGQEIFRDIFTQLEGIKK